jgi:two-component system LytT family sensor kinase
MPFIVLAYNAILYPGRFLTDWRIWAVSWPIIYSIGIVSWYLHIQYDHTIRRKFPSLSQTRKRIFYKVLINPLVMTPSVLLIFWIYDHFHVLGYRLRTSDLKWGYLIGLSINLLFDTLWEVLYLLEKYRESLQEKALLEKMSIEHEFENLKGQINPHFLFNCFNTLSSLIEENKTEAEHFLDELSKVYRYLLRNNESGISTVEKEIRFIQSYFELLRTRYGEGLQLNMDIDLRYYPYQLPSLSLQLLVENAVKHNIVSRQQPLIMEIFTTAGNKLVVNNNLQRKSPGMPSTRIGLSNIQGKYRLLQQEGFQIVEGEKNFMVVLPLIWINN